jgi:putative ABC transport system permease protein
LSLLFGDISYTVRVMRRTPLFTATVVLTVMLAIAANTTIFSVVNAVLLRPLPFREPNRLVQVAEKNDKLNLPTFGSSVLNFLDWREQSKSFDELAAVGFNNYTLTGTGEPEQFSGNRISPALMRVLGIPPIAGRVFTDDEEQPNAAPVAMLGEGLWKRRFGADRGLIGRTIILNDTPTIVVGIAPAALNLISGGEVYTPLTIDRAKEIRLNHVIFTFGRLKNGVSIEQAQAEMNGISARMGQQYPPIRDWGIHLVSIFDTFVSPDLKTGLLVLLWAVVFVLLIACANIANLLLARAAIRQNEMAVRTAIGASRRRLVRQLLVESVMLSLFGGIAGLGGAFWAVHTINRFLPPNTLPIPAVEIDATVFWFALVLTVVTGLLFGIVPAWRTAKVDLHGVLKQGGRGSTGRMSARLRNGLAAVEIALATVLLIGAGLFIRSLANLERVRLGFDPQGLMTFQLAPPTTKYPLNSKAPQFYRALLDALQSIPGARGAAVSSGIPFGAGAYNTHPMITTDRSILPPDAAVPIDWRTVSPGYFKAMGIPLLEGRDFRDADGPIPALPVMIVSRDTAKKFWGDADRRADRWRARRVSACDPSESARTRLGAGTRQCEDDGAVALKHRSAAATQYGVARRICIRRVAYRLDRHLWRARIFGEPAHGRNWSTHGLGRYTARRFASYCRRRNEGGANWDWNGGGRRPHARPNGVQPDLRCPGARSSDVYGRRSGASRCRACSLCDSCTSCVSSRPNSRATLRVVADRHGPGADQPHLCNFHCVLAARYPETTVSLGSKVSTGWSDSLFLSPRISLG